MDRAADDRYPTMTTVRNLRPGATGRRMPPCIYGEPVRWRKMRSPSCKRGLHLRLRPYGRSSILSAMPTGHEQHEVLMIGTRGDIPAPLPAQQARSVGKASVGAHSEKPAVFAEIIERAQADLPKLNMFARRVATLARVVEWLTEAKDCRKLGGGTQQRHIQSYNKPTPSRFACPFPWCIFFSAGDSPLDNRLRPSFDRRT